MNGTGRHNFSFFEIVDNLFDSRNAFLKKAAPNSRPLRKNPQEGDFALGDVVEDVRTVFEERDDVAIYIPNLVSAI